MELGWPVKLEPCNIHQREDTQGSVSWPRDLFKGRKENYNNINKSRPRVEGRQTSHLSRAAWGGFGGNRSAGSQNVSRGDVLAPLMSCGPRGGRTLEQGREGVVVVVVVVVEGGLTAARAATVVPSLLLWSCLWGNTHLLHGPYFNSLIFRFRIPGGGWTSLVSQILNRQ